MTTSDRPLISRREFLGRSLTGFVLDDCPRVFGDAIERPVTWRKGGDVGGLAGRPVRLRFVLRDADRFAFRFSG